MMLASKNNNNNSRSTSSSLNPREHIRLNSTANAITIILLISAASISPSSEQQLNSNQQQHESQSSFHDEEIVIEPHNDYNRFSSVDHKPTAYDILSLSSSSSNNNHENDGRSSRLKVADREDPFAVTFSDYLEQTARDATDTRESSSSSPPPPPPISPTAKSQLGAEEDENLVTKPRETSIIDYVFPPSFRQETKPSDSGDQKKEEIEDPNSNDLFGEIKLLFAWKTSQTSKCSKICGGGFRINHLSCIDLKYDVRVEDELCLKSKLPRPSETSADSCNQIDCKPQWTSTVVDRRDCGGDTAATAASAATSQLPCDPKSYRRVQCTMIDRRGVQLVLDDSECYSASNASESNQTSGRLESNVNATAVESRVSNNNDDASTTSVVQDDDEELNVDSFLGDDRSDAFAAKTAESPVNFLLGLPKTFASSRHQLYDEPFMEPGNWSECYGAPCGQLGKRSRRLQCRLHLSKSSKTVDLPSSSCHHAHSPDSVEPCYIDCGPLIQSSSYSETDVKSSGSEQNDETIYDLEMTRFEWKEGGWTKCSAECLGGQRESIIECSDKLTNTIVDSSRCDRDLKPPSTVENCNQVPCAPEWRIDSFSKCSKHCGSSGIRTRSVTCVQQVLSQTADLSYLIVSNDLCLQINNSTVPDRMEPCNRVDCKPEWSVGPWSQCDKRCGEGLRNRTVICVQEFAHKDGPQPVQRHNRHKVFSQSLIEAAAISAQNWHPGKVTQVPFQECYEEYKTIPSLEEKCFSLCEREPYIDADMNQNFRMTHESSRKKTVTLKVGGRAQVMEGRNLKIRCKVINKQQLTIHDNLVKKNGGYVEWKKDGVRIFWNGSITADKQYTTTDDNTIFNNDVLIDDRNQFMADEPVAKRSERSHSNRHNSKPQRNLGVRSWIKRHDDTSGSERNFSFQPLSGGRFSLVKENTLRIKRLRADDSGLYTCSYGSLSESMDLRVIPRRDLYVDTEEKLANHLGGL